MQPTMSEIALSSRELAGDIYAPDAHSDLAKKFEIVDILKQLPKERIEQLSADDKATYLAMIGRDDLITVDEKSTNDDRFDAEGMLTKKLHATSEKGRVDVDTFLSVNELMAKYDIPKATAWRAKQRGYFVSGYHEKSQPLSPDSEWFTSNQEEIDRSIEIGVRSAVNQYPIGDREISVEDLKAEAMLRIFELSGVVKNRENKGWLINVAKNAARSFIKKHHPVRELSEFS